MPTPSVAISVTSTPVWNARPAPVCTITRTSGSASSSFHATANSSRICAVIAFSCSGRLLINQPTGPSRSTIRQSKFEYFTVQPSSRLFECSPERALRRAQILERVLRDLLGQRLGLGGQLPGRVDHLAQDSELIRAPRGDPLVAAGES